MEAIKIEKNVPYVADKSKTRGRKVKYPFSNMKIGDSFQVDNSSVINLLSAANNWKHRSNAELAKFKAKVIDKRGKVVRLWRVE